MFISALLNASTKYQSLESSLDVMESFLMQRHFLQLMRSRFLFRSLNVIEVLEQDCKEEVEKNVLAKYLKEDKESCRGTSKCDDVPVHNLGPIIADHDNENGSKALHKVIEVRAGTCAIDQVYFARGIEFNFIGEELKS